MTHEAALVNIFLLPWINECVQKGELSPDSVAELQPQLSVRFILTAANRQIFQ